MRRVTALRTFLLVSLLTTPALVGCNTTGAQREFAQSNTAMTAAVTELKGCARQIYESPENAKIRPHEMDPDRGQFTVEQLADKSIPTADEAKLVASRFDEAMTCRKSFEAVVAADRPDLIPVLTNYDNQVSQATIPLVQRKLSWGEAAQKIQSLNTDLAANATAANQQWQSNLQAQNDAEMARRRAAAAIMLQSMQNQQMINQQQMANQQLLTQQQLYNTQQMINANRPIYTNCYAAGSMVNCVSN
jgi:hypothetical protein